MRISTYFSYILALLLMPILSLAQVAPPPSLAVKAYLLQDFNSGAFIAEYKKDERIEPA
ncbi:MAG: peptidase, partial [Methylotenera sp.]